MNNSIYKKKNAFKTSLPQYGDGGEKFAAGLAGFATKIPLIGDMLEQPLSNTKVAKKHKGAYTGGRWVGAIGETAANIAMANVPGAISSGADAMQEGLEMGSHIAQNNSNNPERAKNLMAASQGFGAVEGIAGMFNTSQFGGQQGQFNPMQMFGNMGGNIPIEMKNGGTLPKYPGGGVVDYNNPNAELEKKENGLQSPDNPESPQAFQVDGPTHEEVGKDGQTGVPVNLKPGAEILSDDKKNEIMYKGKKVTPAKAAAPDIKNIKFLEKNKPNDTISQNTIKRLTDNVNNIFSEQEAQKLKRMKIASKVLMGAGAATAVGAGMIPNENAMKIGMPLGFGAFGAGVGLQLPIGKLKGKQEEANPVEFKNGGKLKKIQAPILDNDNVIFHPEDLGNTTNPRSLNLDILKSLDRKHNLDLNKFNKWKSTEGTMFPTLQEWEQNKALDKGQLMKNGGKLPKYFEGGFKTNWWEQPLGSGVVDTFGTNQVESMNTMTPSVMLGNYTPNNIVPENTIPTNMIKANSISTGKTPFGGIDNYQMKKAPNQSIGNNYVDNKNTYDPFKTGNQLQGAAALAGGLANIGMGLVPAEKFNPINLQDNGMQHIKDIRFNTNPILMNRNTLANQINQGSTSDAVRRANLQSLYGGTTNTQLGAMSEAEATANAQQGNLRAQTAFGTSQYNAGAAERARAMTDAAKTRKQNILATGIGQTIGSAGMYGDLMNQGKTTEMQTNALNSIADFKFDSKGNIIYKGKTYKS